MQVKRVFLRLGFGCAAFCGLLGAHGPDAQGQCAATPSQTEGPYYRTPNPETNNIRIAGDGPLLTLTGQVVDQNCNPIPYTWLAFWHADPTGAYDNAAPFDRYRCFFFTDAQGRYTIYTIMPGLYPGRTRHIHVKADAVNTALLTTQFYFPNEPQNASDGLYNPALEMALSQNPDGSYSGSYEVHLVTSGGCTAPTVTADPASITRAPGATATFSVAATGGTPMTYEWRRNGTPVVNDARISGATTSTLTITGVNCIDDGSYECSALNSCGGDPSAAATLTVSGCACAGDVNGDGSVGLADLSILLTNFGGAGGAGQGDINGDGQVTLADLSALLAVFRSTC